MHDVVAAEERFARARRQLLDEQADRAGVERILKSAIQDLKAENARLQVDQGDRDVRGELGNLNPVLGAGVDAGRELPHHGDLRVVVGVVLVDSGLVVQIGHRRSPSLHGLTTRYVAARVLLSRVQLQRRWPLRQVRALLGLSEGSGVAL